MSTNGAVSTPSKGSVYWQEIKQNLKAEWECFKMPIIWGGILIGAIFQYLHNVAHNYVYYLAGVYDVYGGPENALVDLGFKALQPSIADLSFLPSNGCLYSLAAIAVIFACSPIFTKKLIRIPNLCCIQMLWRALVVCSVTIVLRCISFFVTILPAPAPQCSQADFNPPTTAYEIFTGFDTENGCSDLIFSSHMMFGITAAALVTQYTCVALGLVADQPLWKHERPLKIALVVLCWCIVVAEGFCIVAQERHYTIDVWTALYAVPLTWLAAFHFFPKDPAPTPKTSDNHIV